MGSKDLLSERLALRPTSEDDADFLLDLLNTPKWIEYIGDRKVYTLNDARQYVKTRMVPQRERVGFSVFTVVRKSDGEKLGTCGLYEREGIEGFDLGFAFLPHHEGQGYAFEGASRIMEACRTQWTIHQLNAITTKHNIASQRLLGKLGFQPSGSIRLSHDKEELFLFTCKL